jgi:hypothetical protein
MSSGTGYRSLTGFSMGSSHPLSWDTCCWSDRNASSHAIFKLTISQPVMRSLWAGGPLEKSDDPIGGPPRCPPTPLGQ